MNIFRLELRNLRKSILISTGSICLTILFLLLFFPSMQTESMQALAGAKLEGVDPALLEALGLSSMMDFTVITNYFGYVMQFVVLVAMVILTQRTVGLLLKEETEGTIEYLCAKPVSRWEIFYQKVLAHVASLLIMTASFIAITVVGYLQITDYSFAETVKETFIFFGSMLFVGCIFSAVGILISALFRGTKGMGITIGIVFGSYILGIFSVVVKDLDFLIWVSPMDWIKTQKLMTEGILPVEWIVGVSVILGCTAAAWLCYRKKDLLV